MTLVIDREPRAAEVAQLRALRRLLTAHRLRLLGMAERQRLLPLMPPPRVAVGELEDRGWR